MSRLLRAIVVAAVAAAALAPAASASELIDRDATRVRLEVNRSGMALLTYRKAGKVRRVLAWGAVNAVHASPGHRQLAFILDYSGGFGSLAKKASAFFCTSPGE